MANTIIWFPQSQQFFLWIYTLAFVWWIILKSWESIDISNTKLQVYLMKHTGQVLCLCVDICVTLLNRLMKSLILNLWILFSTYLLGRIMKFPNNQILASRRGRYIFECIYLCNGISFITG